MIQTYLVMAGALAVVVGLVHSILGEVLIFSGMRQGRIVPTNGRPQLRERYVRILWASWHIVTIFGWTIAAILFALSASLPETVLTDVIKNSIIVSMLASSVLVLYATKGMHPGWLGLLAVSVLCWLA